MPAMYQALFEVFGKHQSVRQIKIPVLIELTMKVDVALPIVCSMFSRGVHKIQV